MKDSFEKKVSELKHQIDFESAPDYVWNNINNAVFEPKKNAIKKTFWLKMAAAVLLLISVTFGGLLYKQLQVDYQYQKSMAAINPAFMEMELDYQNEILNLKNTIDLKEAKNHNLSWLLEELQHLDEVERQFRKDFAKGITNEKVLKNLMDNYEKKLKLLHKIQKEINRRNHEKNNLNHI